MPSDTPPSRVKKAWRRPGMADSSGRSQASCSVRPAALAARRSSPRSRMRCGSEIASDLEHRAHAAAAAVGQPLQRARNVREDSRGVAFAIRVTARVSMPSRLRKSPCVTGPWTRAPRSSAARASAWKSTWAVTSACPGFFRGSVKLWRAIGLKGVAGVAAQMAVIDDQRRAVLIANPARDLHDLGVGPPFEHRA